MAASEFFRKLKSKYLWGNLLAMSLTAVALAAGVKYGLDLYTHHGEAIAIPNLMHKRYADAEAITTGLGLRMEVSDTGYVKRLPPGCILAQTPDPGGHVKAGRVIYVTINATHSPTITLPDIIDNSSLREAMAKLTAMGFKLGTPQFIPGEKDWVYGILVGGRHVAYGDKIPVDAVLTIEVGNGQRDATDSVDYVEPMYEETEDEGDIDEFEEVKEPPTVHKEGEETPTQPATSPEAKQ